MKKIKYFLTFCLVLPIYFLMITNVSGATRCNYKVKYMGSEAIFSIETEGNSDVFTKINSEHTQFKEDVKLDNGNCPDIGIYFSTGWDRVAFWSWDTYNIYNSLNSCTQANGVGKANKNNGKCYEAQLFQQVDPDDISISASTGENAQYTLRESNENSCTYSHENGQRDQITFILKKSKNNTLTKDKCQYSMGISECVLNDKQVEEDFFDESGNLICPQYVYAQEEQKDISGAGNTMLYITLVEIGKEGDLDRWELQKENQQGFVPTPLCPSISDCDIRLQNVCYVPTVARTLQFLGFLLFIAKVLVPLIIIIMGVVNLLKIITAGKTEDAPKYAKNIMTRVIIGVIIFLVPSIIGFIFQTASYIIYGESVNSFENCTNCIFDTDKCIVNTNQD